MDDESRRVIAIAVDDEDHMVCVQVCSMNPCTWRYTTGPRQGLGIRYQCHIQVAWS